MQTPGDNDVLCGRVSLVVLLSASAGTGSCSSISNVSMKLTFFFSTLSLSLSQGGATNAHLGNVRYRALVQAHQNEYLHAEKTKKKEVARSIVSIIRSRGGRILKKCNDGRVGWTDIGDTKAREKTSQGLREGLDVLRKDLEQQNEATVAGAKRKARDDAADDGDNKKKAAETSPTAATVPDATTVATDDDIAAAVEAAMLAAPIRTANRTSLMLAETALAGDPANTTSTPGAATATATAPELVAESAPTYTNVPVPAPAPSYFDYSASYALSASAGTTSGVSASAFNYPGTGYGYPYPYPHPFPGYHPPAGNGYGQYGLSYEANLYATAAASFGIPAPPVTTSVDDGDAEEGKEEEEIFGETAQI